jgi:hypothetical protein
MEALEQMATYVKLMKEFLSKKKRFTNETMELEERCNAIIKKSLL